MKRYISVLIIVSVVLLPHIVFAAWWNPFSWSIFSFLFPSNQQEQTITDGTRLSNETLTNDATTTPASKGKASKETVKKVSPSIVTPPPIQEETLGTPQQVQPTRTLCNGTYWSECPAGQNFVCPKAGNAYCEVPKTDNQKCVDSYGVNSSYSGQKNSDGGPICGCNNGYKLNDSKTSCVVVAVKTGYQSCSETDPNGTWDGTYRSNGNYNCVCNSGYVWSDSQSSCQPQQQASIDNSICQTAIQNLEKFQTEYAELNASIFSGGGSKQIAEAQETILANNYNNELPTYKTAAYYACQPISTKCQDVLQKFDTFQSENSLRNSGSLPGFGRTVGLGFIPYQTEIQYSCQ